MFSKQKPERNKKLKIVIIFNSVAVADLQSQSRHFLKKL